MMQQTFQSRFGPKIHHQPHVYGITARQLATLGLRTSAYGGIALFTVIFFASGIPRVQKDILQKVPGIGSHYVHEIPASDNVRALLIIYIEDDALLIDDEALLIEMSSAP